MQHLLNVHLSYYPASAPVKTAVTLVVHGLNTKPSAMQPLIHWLNQQGSEAYLVRLSGHQADGPPIENITTTLWQQEMQGGYETAKEAATKNSVPLYFLGYSLGALLGQTMVSLVLKRPAFDKQVLLAPALTPRRRASLLKLLFLFGTRIALPSFTPAAYRANKVLPLHVYRILFKEEKKWRNGTLDCLQVPTLIILDPKDELVSYCRLRAWIHRNNLTDYNILTLDAALTGRSVPYHHLVVDEATMGQKNWQAATARMSAFLFSKSQE